MACVLLSARVALMAYVLLSSRVASVSNVEFAADISYFVLSRKHLFGVLLVRMTALHAIRTAGELTAMK